MKLTFRYGSVWGIAIGRIFIGVVFMDKEVGK